MVSLDLSSARANGSGNILDKEMQMEERVGKLTEDM